jgi:phage repressor protein C with HTH and peptisase S24 domain
MRDKNTQMTVNQRINFLIERFEAGNKSAFGRRVDMKSGVVGDLVGGRLNKPSFEALLKILSAYPSVNTDWLLKGEGEPIRSTVLPKKPSVHSTATEPRIVAIAEGDNTAAPLYNIRTAASYLGAGQSQERPEPDGVISLPNWLLRRGDHAVFPVVGDSMEPTFFAKDYVLCRFLPKPEWAHLREDTVAVVVSESRGLQLKRLTFRAGEEYVRCRSDNRQHPAYNLDLDEVLEVWRFEWRITANAHNPTEGLSERVSTVEDTLEDMRILLEQVLDRKELKQLEVKRGSN